MGNMLDSSFYEESDYHVQLTMPQIIHYNEIFVANDIENRGTLNVRELAHMMRTMGHGLSEHDLQKLIMDAGIDQDRNGKLDMSEFMEFVRQSLTADLPLSKMAMLEREFKKRAKPDVHPALDDHRLSSAPIKGRMAGISEDDEEGEEAAPKAVAAGPDTISKAEFVELMHMMGFHLDEQCATDIFKTIDTDHSGRVSYEEFVLGIGVLKRQMIDLKRLEKSFQFFVEAMQKMEKEEKLKRAEMEKKNKHLKRTNSKSNMGATTDSNVSNVSGGSSTRDANSQPHLAVPKVSCDSGRDSAGAPATEENSTARPDSAASKFRTFHITAKHVRAALKIPKHEAEDLVFIADTENDGEEEPAIDFFEFHELVTNFT